jgi:hypothetical protein
MRIAVIGSRNHDRAECFDWLQPFPNLEEYDSIIINLQSLTQDIFVYDSQITKNIRKMKEEISTIIQTGREVFCIINKMVRPYLKPIPFTEKAPKRSNVIKRSTAIPNTIQPRRVPPTNYGWIPLKVMISTKRKGTSVNVTNHRFDNYFDYVGNWNYEISIVNADNILQKVMEHYMSLVEITVSGITKRFILYPIALNKSKKVISGTLKPLALVDGNFVESEEGGAIHLLLPPTKCEIYQAIEIILDIICEKEEKHTPFWRKDIDIPKIHELEQNIKNKIQEIEGIQQNINKIQTELRIWDSYRDLFTESGDNLEYIVQNTLADIGVNTKKTKKGLPVDLISKKVAVEVTGIKGVLGVSSEKVNQTGRFKESYNKGEKILLIANTHMDLPPKEREGKMHFSPEVQKYFEALSVCCMTTMTLFQLWRDVVTGKRVKKDVQMEIFTTKGELKLSEM